MCIRRSQLLTCCHMNPEYLIVGSQKMMAQFPNQKTQMVKVEKYKQDRKKKVITAYLICRFSLEVYLGCFLNVVFGC